MSKCYDDLTEKDIKVLQALRTIIQSNQKYLSFEGHELFNELADRADNQNLVW